MNQNKKANLAQKSNLTAKDSNIYGTIVILKSENPKFAYNP